VLIGKDLGYHRSKGDTMIRRRGYARPKLAIITAGFAGLVAAGMVSAGPATADQAQDDQYFTALQQIYPGRNIKPAIVVDNAHKICGHLGRGDGFDTVVNDLRGPNPSHSVEQVQQEVHLAQSTYCP
jgi:Protein of unknown function (DUF732)